MNNKVINNLFEFWSYIGLQNNSCKDYLLFKTVSILESDWPKRVYAIADTPKSYAEIAKKYKTDNFPKIVTVHQPTKFLDANKYQLSFTQTNMCLDLIDYKKNQFQSQNIYQIKTESEAFEFAKIASQAFNYKVDGTVVYNVIQNSKIVKMYIFKENKINFGCGIIFFDSNNIAGFHMIGTIPEGRGRGIGKSITQRLINEAINNSCSLCVLNASKMGESIYKNLGFTAVGTLQNYKIL